MSISKITITNADGSSESYDTPQRIEEFNKVSAGPDAIAICFEDDDGSVEEHPLR